jgi:hypothetical protein
MAESDQQVGRFTAFRWNGEKGRGGSLIKSGSGLYFSPDGTPGGATIWFRGAPVSVRRSAKKTVQEQATRLAQTRRKHAA